MIAVILICASLAACDDRTAIDVLRPPGTFSNPMHCLSAAQAFLAQSHIDLGGNVALIQCRQGRET